MEHIVETQLRVVLASRVRILHLVANKIIAVCFIYRTYSVRRDPSNGPVVIAKLPDESVCLFLVSYVCNVYLVGKYAADL